VPYIAARGGGRRATRRQNRGRGNSGEGAMGGKAMTEIIGA
jgi:hypothetical protein